MGMTIEKPRVENEPPFMKGYGDWAVDRITQNPYTPGSIAWQEYQNGNEDAKADDRIPLQGFHSDLD